MYFQTLADLINMDGHGGYVWSAYLVAVVVVALILLRPLRRQRAILQQISSEMRRQSRDAGNSSEGAG